MEIVNKFLNRDIENQKLKHIAVEVEKQLEVCVTRLYGLGTQAAFWTQLNVPVAHATVAL